MFNFMGLDIISFLKILPWKWVISFLILSLLFFGYRWHVGQVHMAGYNEAKAEALVDLQKQLAEKEKQNSIKVADVQARLVAAESASKVSTSLATSLQQKLDSRPTIEVIKNVENLTTSCDNLGTDYLRLYNDIIGSAPTVGQ